MAQEISRLGVVVVTYQSDMVIGACLSSLIAADGPPMRIVVVDNASTDRTIAVVRDFQERMRGSFVELIEAGCNRGFAAGVNIGLDQLKPDRRIDWFWVLNPDCTVPVGTPVRYLDRLETTADFALMGGRTVYADRPGVIQSDGGRIGCWTGVSKLVNKGAVTDAPAPGPDTIDFISGANMIASRPFLERAGPMDEGYFLFYEEVEWAARRGDLSIALCPEATVHHRAGTSTGSAGSDRAASPFANYYNYRGRMRFLARNRPWALPSALVFAVAKSIQTAIRDGWREGFGALCGTLFLPPPALVRRGMDAPAPGSTPQSVA